MIHNLFSTKLVGYELDHLPIRTFSVVFTTLPYTCADIHSIPKYPYVQARHGADNIYFPNGSSCLLCNVGNECVIQVSNDSFTEPIQFFEHMQGYIQIVYAKRE